MATTRVRAFTAAEREALTVALGTALTDRARWSVAEPPGLRATPQEVERYEKQMLVTGRMKCLLDEMREPAE